MEIGASRMKNMSVRIGRIVTKLAGREAGQRAVIVKLIDRNFALITGAGISDVKRRRANIRHIEPMAAVVDIKQEASDDEVAKAVRGNAEALSLLENKA